MPSLAPALRWTPASGSTAGPTTTFPTAGRDTPGHEPVSWVDAGAVAIAAGVAQRHADGSVVFASPALDPSEPPPDLSDGPAVQRATDTTPATDNATPPPPAPPAPGSTAPGTTAGHAGANSAELDELAKRLYGRLRVMLKHELRLDRERAGVLTQGRR
jgi:hypothetical protein